MKPHAFLPAECEQYQAVHYTEYQHAVETRRKDTEPHPYLPQHTYPKKGGGGGGGLGAKCSQAPNMQQTIVK